MVSDDGCIGSNGEKVIAFIMLITDSGSTQDVLKKLREMKEVKEAYMIYGDWDIIVKVILDKLSDLQSFMMTIRKALSVKKSATLIALNE